MRATHGCAFGPSSSSFRNCKRCVSYEDEKEPEDLCRTSRGSPRVPRPSLRSLPTSTPKRLSTRITSATATTMAPSSSLYSRNFPSSSSSIHSRSGSQTHRGRDSSTVTRARPLSCCPPSQCQKECRSTQKGVCEEKNIYLSSSLQRQLSQDPKKDTNSGTTRGKVAKQASPSPGLNTKKDILADVCQRIARILDQVKTESFAFNTTNQPSKPKGEKTGGILDSRKRKESEGKGANDSCRCEQDHAKCVIRRNGVTPPKSTKKRENDEFAPRMNEKAEIGEEKGSGLYCPSCRSMKTSSSDKEESYERTDPQQEDHEENHRSIQIRLGNRRVACRYSSVGETKKSSCPPTTTPRLESSSLSPTKGSQKQQKTPRSRNTSSQNTFHIARLEVGLKKTTEKNKALQEERKVLLNSLQEVQKEAEKTRRLLTACQQQLAGREDALNQHAVHTAEISEAILSSAPSFHTRKQPISPRLDQIMMASVPRTSNCRGRSLDVKRRKGFPREDLDPSLAASPALTAKLEEEMKVLRRRMVSLTNQLSQQNKVILQREEDLKKAEKSLQRERNTSSRLRRFYIQSATRNRNLMDENQELEENLLHLELKLCTPQALWKNSRHLLHSHPSKSSGVCTPRSRTHQDEKKLLSFPEKSSQKTSSCLHSPTSSPRHRGASRTPQKTTGQGVNENLTKILLLEKKKTLSLQQTLDSYTHAILSDIAHRTHLKSFSSSPLCCDPCLHLNERNRHKKALLKRQVPCYHPPFPNRSRIRGLLSSPLCCPHPRPCSPPSPPLLFPPCPKCPPCSPVSPGRNATSYQTPKTKKSAGFSSQSQVSPRKAVSPSKPSQRSPLSRTRDGKDVKTGDDDEEETCLTHRLCRSYGQQIIDILRNQKAGETKKSTENKQETGCPHRTSPCRGRGRSPRHHNETGRGPLPSPCPHQPDRQRDLQEEEEEEERQRLERGHEGTEACPCMVNETGMSRTDEEEEEDLHHISICHKNQATGLSCSSSPRRCLLPPSCSSRPCSPSSLKPCISSCSPIHDSPRKTFSDGCPEGHLDERRPPCPPGVPPPKTCDCPHEHTCCMSLGEKKGIDAVQSTPLHADEKTNRDCKDPFGPKPSTSPCCCPSSSCLPHLSSSSPPPPPVLHSSSQSHTPPRHSPSRCLSTSPQFANEDILASAHPSLSPSHVFPSPHEGSHLSHKQDSSSPCCCRPPCSSSPPPVCSSSPPCPLRGGNLSESSSFEAVSSSSSSSERFHGENELHAHSSPPLSSLPHDKRKASDHQDGGLDCLSSCPPPPPHPHLHLVFPPTQESSSSSCPCCCRRKDFLSSHHLHNENSISIPCSCRCPPKVKEPSLLSSSSSSSCIDDLLLSSSSCSFPEEKREEEPTGLLLLSSSSSSQFLTSPSIPHPVDHLTDTKSLSFSSSSSSSIPAKGALPSHNCHEAREMRSHRCLHCPKKEDTGLGRETREDISKSEIGTTEIGSRPDSEREGQHRWIGDQDQRQIDKLCRHRMQTHSPLCLSSSSPPNLLKSLSRRTHWTCSSSSSHRHPSSLCQNVPLSSSSTFKHLNRRHEDFKMIRRERQGERSEEDLIKKTPETEEHDCSCCCFHDSLDSSSSSSSFSQHNRCCPSFFSSASSSSSLTPPPLFSHRKSSPCHSPFHDSHRKGRKNKRHRHHHHHLLSSSSSSCCSSPCHERKNHPELYHGTFSVFGNEGSSEGHSLMNVSLTCPEPCDVCTRKDKSSPLDGCISWNLPSQSR